MIINLMDIIVGVIIFLVTTGILYHIGKSIKQWEIPNETEKSYTTKQ